MSSARESEPMPGGEAGAASAAGAQFERLLAVMDRLRSPGGCPWDAQQTHESLLRYLVEESYEVVEAVEAQEPSPRRRDDLVEELGDVLLQVVFHARIGEEHPGAQRFDISDVVTAVTDKLVRRHPAVFGAGDRTEGGTEPTGAELAARWDAVKQEEKPQRTRIFDGVPPALPALAHAEKVLSKARRHGIAGVEPAAPVPEEQREAAEQELGQRLLREVEAASALGLDPERALRAAARRFTRENDGPVPG